VPSDIPVLILFAAACGDAARHERDGAPPASPDGAQLPAAREAGIVDQGAPDRATVYPATVDAASRPPDAHAPADAPLPPGLVDGGVDIAGNEQPIGSDADAVADLPAREAPTAVAPGFVWIPADRFQMGSPAGEAQAGDDEQPSHWVTLSRSFLLSDHEVTQGEWRAVMGDAPSYHDECGDECPVESITWYAALAFTNALSTEEGLPSCYVLESCNQEVGGRLACEAVTFTGLDCLGYRLPTEAEWEYAARAAQITPTQLLTPLDDWWLCRSYADPDVYESPLLSFCHYVCSEGNGPTNVRSLLPNAWGLFDMAGNVEEWVWDVYGPYSDTAASDPLGPPSGTTRVVRSNSYASYGPDCRHARRDHLEPSWASTGIGLRVARTSP
jgi:sulfatase modifying factor 1